RFEENRSKPDDIIPGDRPNIAKIAAFLKDEKNKNINLRLEGHADRREHAGSDKQYEENLNTARDRAQKMQKELTDVHQIDKSRIKLTIGFSSTLPIDSSDDNEGRQNNRR